jgi:hypothetical protein
MRDRLWSLQRPENSDNSRGAGESGGGRQEVRAGEIGVAVRSQSSLLWGKHNKIRRENAIAIAGTDSQSQASHQCVPERSLKKSGVANRSYREDAYAPSHPLLPHT